MPFEVDPLFANSGRSARQRKRRRLGARIALGLVTAIAIVGVTRGVVGWFNAPLPPEIATSPDDTAAEDAFALVQTAETADAAIAVERQNAFVDLLRDPMILRLAPSETEEERTFDAPAGFAKGRLGLDRRGAVIALSDRLFVAEKRLVTTLPSSRDDFALFKAQRSQGLQAAMDAPVGPAVAQGRLVAVSEASSWGELMTSEKAQAAEVPQAAIYVETQIENTTSVAVTLRESQRQPLYRDEVIVQQAERKLENVLLSAGLDAPESASVARAAAQKLELPEPLPAGSVVALRLRPNVLGRKMMLMSVYSADGYLASLAQVGAGRFEPAADAWIGADLLARSDTLREGSQAPGEIRLLDAFYSAAIRNGLPTKLVGELIVLLSQQYDLDRFVARGDEMVVLRSASRGPLARGLGEVLYVGIHGREEMMPCYILASANGGNFNCYDFEAPATASGGPGALGGGFLVPVNGVKTSGFGPRHHPILKQVRNHNGVDWAAPTGTPVLAVAAGRVARAGDGGGYGNVVYLDHGNGIETRYAHLNAFAKGLRRGTRVEAGQVIGYVGTTGRSTGPHLHFELRVDGRPLDPLSFAGVGSGTGTQAVEALVDQIIRVESAGVATAKNPLSTATGLGQFIQSTWLRMMRDYRPDLTRQMNRAELLALRNDPALSRAMVRNLARENESFLRARGHQITAGRLYLAHFLGPAGAHTALRADPSETVLEVMGARVVSANPFLRGKTIAALRSWADRKMARRGGARTVVPQAPAVRVVPPEVIQYRDAVDAMLAAL
ncbi:M23 peptidase domain protein [Sulfitobacter noctilucae]|uniref:peptidoglycan DD-metalloendopeptidase family protein n=1 Tax=Sulfitobacter noctilucae TaxID=1342302 RepID=UPI00046B037F|nr:M23 family metallopeptidase [Sulfitobacter noctilucae]KIN75131.1 M23 peptidase domain protein [Sulfitobacter noctilucae]